MDETRLEELFASLGAIRIRRMFGGQGIYHQDVIVAVVVDGELLMKADAQTQAAFREAGCHAWTGTRDDGRVVQMPYWSVPDDALDDPAAFAPWARLGWEAGLRARAGKTKKAKG